MIQERRVIIFPQSDLLSAITAYCQKAKRELPPQPPQSVLVDPAMDEMVTLNYGTRADGQPRNFSLKREEVGAALIAQCRASKIPLPKSGTKQVDKWKDGAALLVQNRVLDIHVMVIDDQETMRSIIKKLLQRANIHQVTEAEDGRKALEMLFTQKDLDPDVILCDLHMEGMDGLEFLRKLRSAASPHRAKPVLILTGDKSARVFDAAQAAGATRLLHKPIAADDLATEIRKALGYLDQGTAAGG